MKIELLGSPVLLKKALEVSLPLTEEIKHLCEQMLDKMLKSDGVGIAAPQVGHSHRIIIIASSPNDRYPNAPIMAPVTMLNPKIIIQSEERSEDWEGCLSTPGIRALVPRSNNITLEYSDLSGKPFTAEYEGFVARIIQHEIDHLDGISFLERVENRKTLMHEEEFKRQVLGL